MTICTILGDPTNLGSHEQVEKNQNDASKKAPKPGQTKSPQSPKDTEQNHPPKKKKS